MSEEKQKGRTRSEENDRIAVESVNKPSPDWRREIFVGRHRPNIADAAAVEVAGRSMMAVMRQPPVFKRRESQYAGDIPENRIGPMRREKRAMATIVEQDEDTNQQTARGNS